MVILTLKEYDGLIGGLIKNANMYIENGDFSKGSVKLSWKSGSNVSILFSVEPIWEENKIKISKAELTLDGLGNKNDIKDSKVFTIINKYLTDFGITIKQSKSIKESTEFNYYVNLAK